MQNLHLLGYIDIDYVYLLVANNLRYKNLWFTVILITDKQLEG